MSRASPASTPAQQSSSSQNKNSQQQSQQSDNGSSSQHTIGPWTLSREIGKGSFAVVFQGRLRPDYIDDRDGGAEDTDHGGKRRGQKATLPSRVAIKIVTRKKLTPKLLENLEGEIAILKEIRHANVVELLDCLKSPSHIYLVMQYCYLGDLTNYIKTRRREGQSTTNTSRTPADSIFDQDQDHFVHPHDGGLHGVVIRSFLAQLAAALQFMRGKNIVHRDIKPQNLLLQEPEAESLAVGHPPLIPQLKVADFGFARHLPSASLAETLCGSPLYMAPEILRYQRYDAKADLWSVGAVLYEMCVGKPPFRALNHVELLKRIERGKDRIVFPDEKSDDTLRRELLRKDPESTEQVVRPHLVAEDLKALIRSLLKKGPVERMSFDDFFASSVLAEYKAEGLQRQHELVREAEERDRNNRLESTSLSPNASQTHMSATSLSASGMGSLETSQTTKAPSTQPLKQTSANASTTSLQRQAGVYEHERKAPLPPSPLPPVSSYYTTKYVVGGGRSPSQVKSSPDSAAVAGLTPKVQAGLSNVSPGASTVPASASSQRDIPTPMGPTASPRDAADASSLEDNVLETPGSSMTHLPGMTRAAAARRTSAAQQPSVGGSLAFDEDKGYVMVEKRNVEVNALADDVAGGVARASTSPSERVWGGIAGVVRRPSRLGKTPSMSGASAPSPVAEAASKSPSQAVSTSSNSPSPAINSTATKFGTTPPSHNTPFALPPGARRPSFNRRPTNQETGLITGSASSRGITPLSAGVGQAPTLTSASSSSALARAINMASVRLFGVPSGMSLRGAAALVSARSRRPFFIGASSSPGGGGDVSDAEMNLLALLNDYGQKSRVICEFADAKLANYFLEGPHQVSNDGSSPYEERAGSISRSGTNSAAARRLSSLSSSSFGRSPTGGSNHPQIHRQSSSSSVSSQSITSQSEVAAAEALVLYVKSLTFLQRGIDATKTFIEARSLPGTSIVASSEMNEVVQWLRLRFNDGYDRADFARSKCGEIPESAQNVDKLIFDKALEIARAAALDELENNREGEHWDSERCILAYETASTMLLALLDPGEEALELSNGAFGTIEKFVKSIDKRLHCLQQTRYQPSPSSLNSS